MPNVDSIAELTSEKPPRQLG